MTRLRDADDDFALQGEYQGELCDRVGRPRRVGLQVVAQGDGEFAAVEYPGGLPGTGWDRQHQVKYHGQRDQQVLTLRGDAATVTVQGGDATVVSTDGSPLGRLRKVSRRGATLGTPAPPQALVLFDGSNTSAFRDGRVNQEGLLDVGTELTSTFRDYLLHVEFRLPYMPYARGQGRSNSGIYLQSRYEVQILDSFGLEGEANECGGLYRYQPPDVNMCLPPLAWQAYDIIFHSPRFDAAGDKIRNAQLTVQHNGVLVHDHFEVQHKTGAGREETPELLPIKFQDHGNPVNFRNIWLIDLDAQPSARRVAAWSCDQPSRTAVLLKSRTHASRWIFCQ